jgi:hypothetical protein
MIRSVPKRANFTYRRRMGDASIAASAVSGGISAGVALASDAANLWLGSINASHMADTATTLIVNGLAQQLQNLLNAYMAEPNPTCADQRAALDAYDNAWMWLQSPQGCGAPNFGAAGNACISDRAPGGKYPWQSYYRDPIANDPRLEGMGCDTGQAVILPSVTSGGYQNTGITSTGGSSTTGQTAAQIATAAATGTPGVPASVQPATVPAAIVGVEGIPTTYLYVAGAALLALILVKS